MTDAEIILALTEKLGGKLQTVAERLGESIQTVSNWKTLPRGIAWPKRGAVADLARELDVEIPADFATAKRPASQAAA